jgi:hypothetical protein
VVVIADIATITDRASENKGAKISKASVNITLAKLKKEKEVKSPSRGPYQKA